MPVSSTRRPRASAATGSARAPRCRPTPSTALRRRTRASDVAARLAAGAPAYTEASLRGASRARPVGQMGCLQPRAWRPRPNRATSSSARWGADLSPRMHTRLPMPSHSLPTFPPTSPSLHRLASRAARRAQPAAYAARPRATSGVAHECPWVRPPLAVQFVWPVSYCPVHVGSHRPVWSPPYDRSRAP